MRELPPEGRPDDIQPSEPPDAADGPEGTPADQPVESPLAAAGDEPGAGGFSALTLWDVLARGVRAPRRTWRQFWRTIRAPEATAPESAPLPEEVVSKISAPEEGAPPDSRAVSRPAARTVVRAAGLAPLGLMALGLGFGLIGSTIMAVGTNRSEELELAHGAPWLLLGFVLWLIAAAVKYRAGLAHWRQRRRGRPALEAPGEDSGGEGAEAAAHPDIRTGVKSWLRRYQSRLGLAAFGFVLSLAAYLFNGNNTFTSFGVFVWLCSIMVWLAALTPLEFDPVTWVNQKRQIWIGSGRRNTISVRLSWTVIALIAIMIVAGYFRLTRLDAVPPEMTSDHVEKLLDAQRVLEGTTQVFFPNNGGREPIQMYLVALFSQITGLGMQFITLKWVSVLEGLLTIPILWWMGREIIGRDQPKLANMVGLLLAALVAVSYWHVALSRLALRIVITPLVMALVMVFLARGMRYNRRADFLKAGLALGFGVYAYQAVRMIPIVVVLGVALAFLFRAHTWGERRRYLTNLAALVLITVVVFVPLGRFMLEYPNLFWMRTEGRLLGDDIITETDPETGRLVERQATLEDRFAALERNLPVLNNNIRNALFMFNWKGDVAWINGAPNHPAMDAISGTFLVLGIAAWLVRMVRRRDVVDWLILPALFIMLLPSALSIAFPVENPSATRTSGALPLAYLLAAFGMAVLFVQIEQTFRSRYMRVVSVAVAIVLLWGAYSLNSGLYFGEYVRRYTAASQPYRQAGRILRGFAESNGSYGNAFMVAYPYWLDHRAIGIESGLINWPNGLLEANELAQKMRENAGTAYGFDPNRSVLFFFNQNDTETPITLQEWFPQGTILAQPNEDGQSVKDFYTFIAPPPGETWFNRFLASHPPEQQ